jgi:hypothetical protein
LFRFRHGASGKRADDVLAAHVAAPAQHQRLAVPADVGDQFHAARRAHQRAAFAFVRQCVEIADLGHGEFVAQVARLRGVEGRHLAPEQIGIEVAVDRKLRAAALERSQGNAQVGHDPGKSPVTKMVGVRADGAVGTAVRRGLPCSARRGFYLRGSRPPCVVNLPYRFAEARLGQR